MHLHQRMAVSFYQWNSAGVEFAPCISGGDRLGGHLQIRLSQVGVLQQLASQVNLIRAILRQEVFYELHIQIQTDTDTGSAQHNH